MTPTTAAFNTLEGTRYLLGKNVQGQEWVSRYLTSEIEEIFTAAEITELNRTGMVHQPGRDGGIMWIDMIGSARATFLGLQTA